MALARGILIWLPLQRLLPYYGTPAFEQIIGPRLVIVNRLTPEEYLRLTSLPQLAAFRDPARYVAVCTYQGEVTDWGSIFVPPQALRRRAELLGDAESYRLYASAENLKTGIDNGMAQSALETDNIGIQAAALGFWRWNGLADPQAIRWTDRLLQAARAECNGVIVPGHNEELVGYVGAVPLAKMLRKIKRFDRSFLNSFLAYLRGYFKARSDRTTDGVIVLTEEEKSIAGVMPRQTPDEVKHLVALRKITAEAGCVVDDFPVDDILIYAVGGLQWKPLRHLLSRGAEFDQFDEKFQLTERYTLNPATGQRAYLIAEALGPDTPNSIRALAGLPLWKENSTSLLRNVMYAVAHPQIAEWTSNDAREGRAQFLYRSRLLYDPLVLFQKGFEKNMTAEIYARGLYAEVLLRWPEITFATTYLNQPLDAFPNYNGSVLNSWGKGVSPITVARLRLLQEYGLPLPDPDRITTFSSSQILAFQQFYPGFELGKLDQEREIEQKIARMREFLAS